MGRSGKPLGGLQGPVLEAILGPKTERRGFEKIVKKEEILKWVGWWVGWSVRCSFWGSLAECAGPGGDYRGGAGSWFKVKDRRVEGF